MTLNKRLFLKSGVAATGLFIGYSLWRGFRYPPLMWTVSYDDGQYHIGHKGGKKNTAEISTNDAILLTHQYSAQVSRELLTETHLNAETILFRAYAPEPVIQIRAKANSHFNLVINNVHQKAKWKGLEGRLHQIDNTGGTNHIIHAQTNSSGNLVIQAQFPRDDGFSFAVIGDTGGDTELDWCLQRAQQLEADFLLHLGDFVYQAGDYLRAVRQFHNSEIPCYISVGNHDFHHKGKIFQPYINELGVFSHYFRLHNAAFINLDTANDFFPPSAGERGKLLKSVAKDNYQGALLAPQSSYVFSHRPLKDMRPDDDHHINGMGETKWLKQQFKNIGVSHYLCGHVHHKFETDLEGILQLNAGQGLSHEDLLVNKPISEMLIITEERGLLTKHDWHRLAMPSSYYRNSVHLRYLKHKGVKDLSRFMQRYPKLKDSSV